MIYFLIIVSVEIWPNQKKHKQNRKKESNTFNIWLVRILMRRFVDVNSYAFSFGCLNIICFVVNFVFCFMCKFAIVLIKSNVLFCFYFHDLGWVIMDRSLMAWVELEKVCYLPI